MMNGANGTAEVVCDWTAVHDAVDGRATAVKVYGTCTCDAPGYTLRLEPDGERREQSPDLGLTLLVDPPAEEMAQEPTPYVVEYQELREGRVERVTISGAAEVTLEVMHPREV